MLVYGVGIAIFKSAPRRLLGWLVLILYAAWIGQMAGARAFGGYASGFTSALVMTIVAFAIERLPAGPVVVPARLLAARPGRARPDRPD